jgi:hypothetical protein
MTMGMAGIALAAIVVIVGLATAFDAQLVRGSAPPGVNPRGFFFLPVSDMLLFVVFFAGAIYYRKRPAEHKSLMLLTAINFLPAALFRIPVVPPEFTVLWAFGVPILIALACLGWQARKHQKLNKTFAGGILLLIISLPLRMFFGDTKIWLDFADSLASLR